MISNREIKEKGKALFRAKYWWTVLALLVVFGIAVGSQSYTSLDFSSYSVLDESGEVISVSSIGALDVIFSLIGVVIIFIYNPISVGLSRYLLNLDKGDAKFTDLFFVFKSGYYWKVVLGTFLAGLYTALWSLLFIVPGIIRSYMYAQVYYILAENPELGKEALDRSKTMMNGYKAKLFWFNFSFIGWDILNILTFGTLGIFWVNGYHCSSQAVFYKELCLEPVND